MSQFLEQSDRTCSHVEDIPTGSLYANHAELAHDLVDHIAQGCMADLMKRHIYYREALEKSEARAKEHTNRTSLMYEAVHEMMEIDPARKFTVEQLDLIHAALGIISESAELLEAIVNSFLYNKPMDMVNLSEEFGDNLWYVALGLRTTGETFESVTFRNLEKLKIRFPDKFSTEKAMNRDLDAEHEVLSK